MFNDIEHVLRNSAFLVRIPMIYTIDERELEMFGLPEQKVDGVRSKGAEKELTTVGLPIMRLLEIFEGGAPIYLLDNSDVAIIYNIIDDYIKKIHGGTTRSLNAQKVDLSLAKRLDAFGSTIFGHNKSILLEELVQEQTSFGASSALEDLIMDFNPQSKTNRKHDINKVERKSQVGDITEDDFDLSDLI